MPWHRLGGSLPTDAASLFPNTNACAPAGVVTLISIILVAVNFRMILENMLK